MFKYFFILIYLILFSYSHADNKDKIIENLWNTENLNFKFEQNINGKIENGNCTIQYPKKIYCKYSKNNKILVSNGKSLVIKTRTSFYRYPLNKTPLNLILDKKFLIKNVNKLKEKTLDKNYISFKIEENDNEINIFFDNKTFNLIGWQTKVDKNLFKLPIQN
jgi:outer membrane lipoprotein-sorting protein